MKKKLVKIRQSKKNKELAIKKTILEENLVDTLMGLFENPQATHSEKVIKYTLEYLYLK